jgi:hypothetical protein
MSDETSVDDSFCDISYKIGQVITRDPEFVIKYPELASIANNAGPDPPNLWQRAYTDCVNCQNNYCGPNPTNIYPPPVCDCPPNSIYITPEQLDMRRKAEIFKYNKNASDQTKKQKYALLAKGINIYKKRSWAAQSQYYTNPNVNNLPQIGNTLICGTDTPSAQALANCSPTTNNDVPGPGMEICYDKTIPLTRYVTRRIYTFNGTKWPQTAWKPGDNGFPIGKAGRFLM